MAAMLGHGLSSTGTSADEAKKKEISDLKSKLARMRRQLQSINNDVAALGDDPYRMGSVFLATGDGDSDDEYEEFYERDSIRPMKQRSGGAYSAWATDRLLTVFKQFDADKDKEWSFEEFRHFLLRTGCLPDFDSVCGTELEYLRCLEEDYDIGTRGLRFTGFLQLCNRAWPDAQLVRMCKAIGVELRYKFDSEQHRVLKVFQQFGTNDSGRVKAYHFRMVAYECGCLLTRRQAREISRGLVADTRRVDKESVVDPDADQVGAEIDSDELSSDEESKMTAAQKAAKRRKADRVKGTIAFRSYLRWWHEVGFAMACAQRLRMHENKTIKARQLRLTTWIESTTRHLRAAGHLMREHIKQAIIAGVFDSQRPKVPQQTRSRVVVSGILGRPRSAGAAGTPMAVNFQCQRTSIEQAWAHAKVPPEAKAFIDIQFEPEAYTTEEHMKELVVIWEEMLRMDVRGIFRQLPGFMDARPRMTAEDGTPLLAICIHLNEHPFGALDKLRAHLRERTPEAFEKSKTAQDLAAEDEEAKMKGAPPPPPKRKTGERVLISKSKYAGTTGSERGRRRQEMLKKATAAASAAQGKVVFEVPKHGNFQPVLRDMSVRVSSSFSIHDVFSEGASFGRVVEGKVDGAFEIDTQLLAGASDMLQQALEYFRYQAELQTPGRPAGVTTDDYDKRIKLKRLMKRVSMSAMEAGLGFFASVSAALEADNRSGVFSVPPKGKTTPRRAVDGSGYRMSFKTRLALGMLALARKFRRTQDVQVKLASPSFLRAIRDSRFLRAALGADQAARFEEKVRQVGYPAEALKQMKAWWKEQLDAFKISTENRRSSTAGLDEEEEAGEADGAGAGAGAGAGSSFGGPSPIQQRSMRIFKALFRLQMKMKGLYKIVVQIGELRFEIVGTNLDIFSLIRPAGTQVGGKKMAGAKEKKKLKRDENML